MERVFTDSEFDGFLKTPRLVLIPGLVRELQRIYRHLDTSALDRARGFVAEALTLADSYHYQKENMAHAAFLLQAVLFGSIMTLEEWPPLWMPSGVFGWSYTQIGSVIVFVIWLLIHIFVRRQLRYGRWAAIRCAGLMAALQHWSTSAPAPTELLSFDPGVRRRKLKRRSLWDTAKVCLDHLVPIASASIRSDIDDRGLPIMVVRHLSLARRRGTGALCSEWLLTIWSFIILLCIFFRTLYGLP